MVRFEGCARWVVGCYVAEGTHGGWGGNVLEEDVVGVVALGACVGCIEFEMVGLAF